MSMSLPRQEEGMPYLILLCCDSMLALYSGRKEPRLLRCNWHCWSMAFTPTQPRSPCPYFWALSGKTSAISRPFLAFLVDAGRVGFIMSLLRPLRNSVKKSLITPSNVPCSFLCLPCSQNCSESWENCRPPKFCAGQTRCHSPQLWHLQTVLDFSITAHLLSPGATRE